MINIVKVDYKNAEHAAHLISVLNHYASDPMGGNEVLPEYTLKHLPEKLSQFPTAFSFLAYLDGTPIGLINCITGFSTFACRPLINIHDVAVLKSHRGQGVGAKLIAAVEEVAREQGCCKMTLEVLQGNDPAKGLYKKLGFNGYELNPELGHALFWEKKL